jgi:hypothetical protein
MVYEKKSEMQEKHLKVPPGWILGTIKQELEASGGDMSGDCQGHQEIAPAYWRQNCRQYPPTWFWDILYYDLLKKSFDSRYDLRDWCKARLQKLNDPVYVEEQRRSLRRRKD